MDPAALTALAEAVGPAHLVTDADRRAGHEVDWTGRFRGSTPAVVLPGSADDVAAVLEVCREHGLAVVPQGGNTGLVGGGVPHHGEVVLSLRRLDGVGEVDRVAGQVTAGAGASLAAVQAVAGAAGMRYAVDFAARDTATVGGTVATNAGGVHVLRHGDTRAQVVGVEAVLGSGLRVWQLGGLVKDNTGYHLPSLLCGSEGTLGVVTAARLRLVPRPTDTTVALAGVGGIHDAVDAVAALRAGLDELEAAEVLLADGFDLVCRSFGLPRPLSRSWPVYVLLEAAGRRDPTDDLLRALAAVGIDDVAVATDSVRRAALWRYRDDHSLAVGTLGAPHKLDVTLPLGVLAAFVAEVPRRVAAIDPTLRTWQFGHLGDGNIHVNVTGAAPSDDRVDEAVLRLVADMGGSISAEHGIGVAKARWLHLTRSRDEIQAMRAIKSALDPDGILNPGVLLPRA